jgi:potassium-transporting ATPase KdpC subunit
MAVELRRSLIVVILSVIAFGLVYPVAMLLVSQLAFSSQANGSLITDNGRTVGSSLIAQGFSKPQYFLERPSATTPSYNAMATGGSNLGPNSASLYKTIKQRVAAILKLEGPYNPGLKAADIPSDAVTASFSGVDPEISQAYANLQAPRVAAVRHLPLATVKTLIAKHTDGRFLGLFGEPGVNVLELNLALDRTQQ